MNPFDMIVVVILVYFLIIGLLRGGIREITSMAALLGGFYIAYLGYEPFSAVFQVFISTEYIREIVAFIVLFGVIAVSVTLVGALLRMVMKMVLLGMVDRLAGVLIGAVKAVIVVSVLHFLALTFLPSGGAAVVDQSRMAPAFNRTAAAIVYIIPDEVKRDMAARAQRLRFQWDGRDLGDFRGRP